MPTVKVRVNPNNPQHYAILADPNDSWSPWYAQGSPDWHRWTRPSEITDWVEYSLDVPEPPRQFKVGDAVKVINSYTGRIRVRDHEGYWQSVNTDGSAKTDSQIRNGLDDAYVFVGNVADLEPKN